MLKAKDGFSFSEKVCQAELIILVAFALMIDLLMIFLCNIFKTYLKEVLLPHMVIRHSLFLLFGFSGYPCFIIFNIYLKY
jgi:hypothetical protein